MESVSVGEYSVKKWTRGASTFLAWPEKGARLMSWQIQLADGSTRDVIYWPEDADLSNPVKIRGGNPVLFPFVARTFDGGQEDYWKTPAGERLPMPRHGFARDGAFHIESITEEGFTAALEPTAAGQKVYPYAYTFSVTYRFEQLSLFVDFKLENKDSVNIPWCAGHHFYFNLPWHKGLNRGSYCINIPARKAFYHGGSGKLEPVKGFAQETSFDDPSLVDRIHCGLKSNEVVFGSKDGEEQISVKIGDTRVPSPWTALTTWTEDSESPFYCVEPWMGPPSSMDNKKGLHIVEPGKTECFSVEISLC